MPFRTNPKTGQTEWFETHSPDAAGVPIKTEADAKREEQDYRATLPSYIDEDLSPTNRLPWQKDFGAEIVGDEKQPGLIGEDLANTMNSLAAGGGENPNGYYQNLLGANREGPADLRAATLPGSSNPMGQALAKKYSRQSADKIAGFRQSEKLDRQRLLDKELARSTSQLGAVDRHRMQNFKEQWEFQQRRAAAYDQWVAQNNAAKAQFWGSVLNLVGQATATVAAA